MLYQRGMLLSPHEVFVDLSSCLVFLQPIDRGVQLVLILRSVLTVTHMNSDYYYYYCLKGNAKLGLRASVIRHPCCIWSEHVWLIVFYLSITLSTTQNLCVMGWCDVGGVQAVSEKHAKLLIRFLWQKQRNGAKPFTKTRGCPNPLESRDDEQSCFCTPSQIITFYQHQ